MKQNQTEKSDRNFYFPMAAMLPAGGGRFLAQVSDPEPQASDASQKIERSIAYMREHINRPLQVATLAAQARVSPSHFFALFKQRTGSPPMDYFTRLRMRHARQLLDSTSASVKEAAAALGYEDPFYFSRVFKSVHKIAPSVYRRRSREVARPEEVVASARPTISVISVLGLNRSGAKPVEENKRRMTPGKPR